MKVNGERIKQAREIRGLTQEELAFQVEASQPHISLVEQNAQQPSHGLLEAIAFRTGFPTTFFLRASGPDFPLGSLLYRKSRKLSAADAAEIRQKARLALEVVLHLGRRFKQIPSSVPRGKADPEEAAQIMRAQLGVSPDGPISGLMRKLEKSGVLVLYLPVEAEGFDAFSAWTNEQVRRPVIFLKYFSAGDRLRRTLAHELGHLILHQDFLGDLRECDREADRFAAELLFPRVVMTQEAIPPLTLTRLAELKRRWGLSIQALALDASERGIINERQKGYLRAKLRKKGWIEVEPVQIPAEYPRLLRQMVESSFASEKEAVRSLTKSTGVSQGFLESLLKVNKLGDAGYRAREAVRGPETGEERRGNVLTFPKMPDRAATN